MTSMFDEMNKYVVRHICENTSAEGHNVEEVYQVEELVFRIEPQHKLCFPYAVMANLRGT